MSNKKIMLGVVAAAGVAVAGGSAFDVETTSARQNLNETQKSTDVQKTEKESFAKDWLLFGEATPKDGYFSTFQNYIKEISKLKVPGEKLTGVQKSNTTAKAGAIQDKAADDTIESVNKKISTLKEIKDGKVGTVVYTVSSADFKAGKNGIEKFKSELDKFAKDTPSQVVIQTSSDDKATDYNKAAEEIAKKYATSTKVKFVDTSKAKDADERFRTFAKAVAPTKVYGDQATKVIDKIAKPSENVKAVQPKTTQAKEVKDAQSTTTTTESSKPQAVTAKGTGLKAEDKSAGTLPSIMGIPVSVADESSQNNTTKPGTLKADKPAVDLDKFRASVEKKDTASSEKKEIPSTTLNKKTENKASDKKDVKTESKKEETKSAEESNKKTSGKKAAEFNSGRFEEKKEDKKSESATQKDLLDELVPKEDSKSKVEDGMFELSESVSAHINALDASKGQNSKGIYKPGKYHIFKTHNGMINITKTKGIPGAWINPDKLPESAKKTLENLANSTTSGESVGTKISESEYELTANATAHINALDASKGQNAKGVYKPGKYHIFKTHNGMINITKTKGIPGAWINPGGNLDKELPPVEKKQ